MAASKPRHKRGSHAQCPPYVTTLQGEWHKLRVEATGNRITCYYDGDQKIGATDSTFKDACKLGLWTKADSVSYFDDLKVTAK